MKTDDSALLSALEELNDILARLNAQGGIPNALRGLVNRQLATAEEAGESCCWNCTDHIRDDGTVVNAPSAILLELLACARGCDKPVVTQDMDLEDAPAYEWEAP